MEFVKTVYDTGRTFLNLPHAKKAKLEFLVQFFCVRQLSQYDVRNSTCTRSEVTTKRFILNLGTVFIPLLAVFKCIRLSCLPLNRIDLLCLVVSKVSTA